MTKINTTPIVFTGGAYGTYLHWCLDTLTSENPIHAPFTSLGSSHKFNGKHLNNMQGWNSFVLNPSDQLFVRVHPKTLRKESLSKNLDQVCNQANHVIYLYPDHESVLLTINNMFTKMWDNWFDHMFSAELDPLRIYKNWPVDQTLPISQLPQWVLREFLSLYLMPAWFDQVEWYHPDTWSHPKCCVITVNQLLYNFENTINLIKMHCNLQFKKDVAELMPYHQQNLKLQKYTNQDQLCNQIISNVINNQVFEWEELTLTSESWIQWQLRNLGSEIRCHGLDTFPTNSLQLKELLYPV